MTDRVAIRQLPTGVPGLDQILGGGLPEFSFNVIAGAPGVARSTPNVRPVTSKFATMPRASGLKRREN